MLERIKKIKVGNPLDPETMIGSQVSKPNGKS
jgi:aldehyde dehydrogenase (NAD+)/aldehyde dehydrogenase